MKKELKKELKKLKEKLEKYIQKNKTEKVKKYELKIKQLEKELKQLKKEKKETEPTESKETPLSDDKRIENGKAVPPPIEPTRENLHLFTTTFDGHPLQSLAPLSVTKLAYQSGITLLLFYAYVEPEWTPEEHQEALKWAEETGKQYEMTGRLRIAREGFNGTMTGPSNQVRLFCQAMREWKPKIFAQTDFKLTDDLPKGQAFPALKVFPVTEIVNYGLAEKQPSLKNGGVHLNAIEYHKKMEEPNTVIIDVRNTYEAVIGRFNPPPGGAEYIDPKMRVSTEFPEWVDKMKPNLEGKQIMMFCTGGIRCERASALLREKGLDNIYQMQGGIHRYLEHFNEDGGHWIGKNYTFDKRFAHGAKRSEITSNCLSCDKPWDKYRGNKRCPGCRVPLLICDDCQAQNKEKETVCHLCKEQDIKPQLSNREKKLHDKQAVKLKPECGVCSEVFKSRNALFKHLQETGHQNRKAKKK
ncbi:hypothetical protein HK103_001813 [Boothiomyces macroporosus]|uniref:tRNA uridine(34) hydroxylase n=1 Tax=Boothiomyces macroporosus TaxID=261099 RepID=A0AAD5UDT1_9FUNG|nr:hypothetical protein HK103_001813 [Boothiomyces macroporosus]